MMAHRHVRPRLQGVSVLRGIGGSPYDPGGPAARRVAVHEEERRTARSTRLGIGTLACPSCDAPVLLGSHPRAAGHPLACPFCAHAAPLREFLSLAAPSRPARVVVRVRQ